MERRRSLQLSEDLERAILSAILTGRAEVGVVKASELSKQGRSVLKAAQAIATPTAKGALLHMTEVQGLDKQTSSDYLQSVMKYGGAENAAEVLGIVQDKQRLIALVNRAQDMLSSSKGRMDLGALAEYCNGDVGTTATLDSIAEIVKDGLPDPPVGLGLRSLPRLYDYTGGLHGSWVVGGPPKLGKTGVVWQITLDASRTNGIPAIYYDLENSFSVIMARTSSIYKGDLQRIREATANVYYRDSISTLDLDLQRVPAPALVVVDHLQRLPAGGALDDRAGLNRWIHRLDSLKKKGYTVLMISEIGRASYNADPHMGAYKESGEIEYAAETGIQLLPGPGDCIEVHIVANRHRPFKGLACMLARQNEWMFKEMGDGPEGAV